MSFLRNIFWNAQESRLRAGWRLLIQLIINLGLFLGIVFVRVQFTIAADQSVWSEVLMAFGALGVTLFSIWFGVRYLDHRRFSDIGLNLKPKEWWADFGFGLLVGLMVPIGFIFIAQAAGWAYLEVNLSAGTAGIPFVLALFVAALAYLCIGIFEESARTYHQRNLFEGSQKLGVLGAMLVAIGGGAAISVIMHSGNTYFLLFVFVSTAFHGFTYFLTGRAALAIAQHAAWDFTLIVILGLGAEISSSGPTIFQTRFIAAAANDMVSGYHFTLVTFGIMLVTELVGLGLILGWVRWRYGHIQLVKWLAKSFWQYSPR